MDDFERELRAMLNDRVAASPEAFDAPPVLLQRARRRRSTKLTALTASVVVVIGGAAGAITQIAGDNGPRRVITTAPTTEPRPSVPTVICEEDRVDNIFGTRVLPPNTPRVPTAGDPAQISKLASFAAEDVPWLIALGPASWTCHWPLDGGTIVIFDGTTTSGRVPTVDEAPIAVDTGTLVDDPPGARLACSVFDDQAVMEHVNRDDAGDCVHDRTPSRTVTRVDEHVATFVDSDGSRGVGWMLLPTSESAPGGFVTVLTCRPTVGLTADECDTIIADFIARNDAEHARQTTTTATPSPTTTSSPTRVATVACPISYAVVGQAVEPPSTEPRVPAGGDSALFSHLASYAVTDNPRYVALGPSGWSCEGQMAADGDNAIVVYQTAGPGGAAPDIFTAPIAIENDFLWHGGVGSGAACSVFDDPAVVQYMTANFPQELPCPRAGRTVTRIDSHASTFVDADGARGMGWIMLPSSQAADDGRISVLTCRPTDGLTTADCDTIIADWIARNDTTG
jgi:hypothetical protein